MASVFSTKPGSTYPSISLKMGVKKIQTQRQSRFFFFSVNLHSCRTIRYQSSANSLARFLTSSLSFSNWPGVSDPECHSSLKCFSKNLFSSFVERRQDKIYTSRHLYTDSPWVDFSTAVEFIYVVEEGNNLALEQ